MPDATPAPAQAPIPTAPPATTGKGAPVKPVPKTPMPNVEVKPAPKADTKPQSEWRYQDKLKVYGKEIDANWNKDELRRYVQKGLAADRQLEESGKQIKAVQKIFELAKSDPASFMKELGMDPRAWAAEQIAQAVKEQQMTPEERQAYAAQRELDELKAKLKAHEETQTKTAHEAEMSRLRDENEKLFIPALEASELPKTHETLGMMAEVALGGLENGIEFTPEQLARETERRVSEWGKQLFGRFDGKTLLKKLGPELAQKIVDAAIAEYDAGQEFEAQTTPSELNKMPRREPEKRREMTEHEARMALRGPL